MTDRLHMLRRELAGAALPKHVGIIMDGNGRWAELRSLPRLEGHREGSASVRAVTTLARELGISALTLYAFSSQNWARPAEEVAGLMDLLRTYLVHEKPTMLENGIRLSTIGEVDKLPGFVRTVLEEVREATAGGTEMVLTLALSYGGREELARAARLLAEDVAAGRLAPRAIDEAAFASKLFTHDLPPLDLCIRTSGELRISNFLLWQVAYSEIVVTETLWPEFREVAFLEALAAYTKRERRFGLTSAQTRAPAR